MDGQEGSGLRDSGSGGGGGGQLGWLVKAVSSESNVVMLGIKINSSRILRRGKPAKYCRCTCFSGEKIITKVKIMHICSNFYLFFQIDEVFKQGSILYVIITHNTIHK